MSVFATPYARKDNAKDRWVKITWDLGETTDHDGDTATATAQLIVTHSRDRRQFIASVQRVDVKQQRGYRVEMYQPMTGTRVRLASTPVARYSAKALDAAVDAALAEIVSRSGDPDLLAVANPNSPA